VAGAWRWVVEIFTSAAAGDIGPRLDGLKCCLNPWVALASGLVCASGVGRAPGWARRTTGDSLPSALHDAVSIVIGGAPFAECPRLQLLLHPPRLSVTQKTALTRAKKLRKPASHRPRHRRARSAHGTTTRRWSRRDMLPVHRALLCLRPQRVLLSRQLWAPPRRGKGRLLRASTRWRGKDLADHASDHHTFQAFGSLCRICSLLQKRTAVA
jgi:hypothetical protein